MSSFHLASVVRRRPSWQPASAPVSLPDQLSRCQLLPPPAPPPSALPSHPGKDRSARHISCHAASCSAHLLHPPVPCPLIQVATCLICKMVNLRNILLLVLLQNDNLLCTSFLHHILQCKSGGETEWRRSRISKAQYFVKQICYIVHCVHSEPWSYNLCGICILSCNPTSVYVHEERGKVKWI